MNSAIYGCRSTRDSRDGAIAIQSDDPGQFSVSIYLFYSSNNLLVLVSLSLLAVPLRYFKMCDRVLQYSVLYVLV